MDSNTGLYFFPLKEHQGSDELHFKKVILLHLEANQRKLRSSPWWF